MKNTLSGNVKNALTHIIHPESREDSELRAQLCKLGGIALIAAGTAGSMMISGYDISNGEPLKALDATKAYLEIDLPVAALAFAGGEYYRSYTSRFGAAPQAGVLEPQALPGSIPAPDAHQGSDGAQQYAPAAEPIAMAYSSAQPAADGAPHNNPYEDHQFHNFSFSEFSTGALDY